MLSCFPFSYSPLRDDDYNQLFIGPEDRLTEEANDNCVDISLGGVDRQVLLSNSTATTEKLRNLVNTAKDSALSHSGPLPSLPSTPVSNRDNIKLPVPLPRTFRKPDAFGVDSCVRTSESAPVANTTTNSTSFTSSAKSSLLRLGFHRSKGTEHLQQEALRKSSEVNSSAIHSQRYIKLPTNSISRFTDSVHNSSKNSKNSINCHSINSKSKVSPKSNSNSNSSQSPKAKTPISGTSVGISSPPLPKPPLSKTLGLSPVSSSAPSCSLFSSSPKPSPKLSPKPPPRPLTSHPGLSSGTSTVMPRQKVQFASVNISDTSALNDENVCNVSSNTTRETSLTASAPNSGTNASSLVRNGSQSASTATLQPSTSSTSGSTDWNKAGTFINKPARGWLHPDHQIADTGISYAVRYVGCLGINTSMKSLDFDTRSQIAKECINRVCEIGRLKTPDKKRRPEKRINRMLADNPNMDCAGADVNLVITSSYLHLTVTETGEKIAKHEMPNISFASGGDADTLDFVAYVAKDHRYGRACFVLECGGGLAQDVITTIGQAFELRFKEFLKRSPRTTSVNERLETTSHTNCSTVSNSNSNPNIDNNRNGRLEDREYYNDLPGKIPPDGPTVESADSTPLKESATTLQRVPQAAPRSCLKKASLSGSEQHSPNLIDLNIDIQDQELGNSSLEVESTSQESNRLEHQYVNCTTDDSNDNQNKTNDSVFEPTTQSLLRDPFDMQPFNSALAQVTPPVTGESANNSGNNSNNTAISELHREDWYHGPISRKDSEALVVKDGDFLVRESQGSAGQYVLTGMQSGIRKHLLLVDPEGVVRTKDKTFESVSHLINYHRNNGLPIISAESALVLRNAVLVKR